jgi:hypothetical protein
MLLVLTLSLGTRRVKEERRSTDAAGVVRDRSFTVLSLQNGLGNEDHARALIIAG